MKKLSWKYIAAACGAGLLLFTLSAQAALPSVHFGRQMVKFDDLPNASPVPYYYGGVGWYNFYTLDPLTWDTPSGYQAGLKSAHNVIFNDSIPGSSIATIAPKAPLSYSVIYSTGYAFILNSAYLTAAWNDNLKVLVQGYYNGRLVYTRNLTLNPVSPTLVTFPSQLVSDVWFYSSGGTQHIGYPDIGTQFGMDNVSYTLLPITVFLL